MESHLSCPTLILPKKQPPLRQVEFYRRVSSTQEVDRQANHRASERFSFPPYKKRVFPRSKLTIANTRDGSGESSVRQARDHVFEGRDVARYGSAFK